ncbi:type II toxin-antitoxin system YafQ family toxin [Parabacteroides chinchillae]|uniref:mRNA interferase YafQ n=1 Tax=Parabacteroides chinchillae TaxID=871327 RepID=A0A8G2FAJ7_9BACT|nr:type II toxin-antitoxin system YafQ family toxin [Parabacteroides chinchillae]SEF80435.1 mRNA interferase YafQ [Parabacteroides chinchillae]
MKILRFSSQYKKDAKRFRNQPKKMEKVVKILGMLRDEIPIPPEYSPHMLKGDYKGCMECHVEGDFLLIWIDETENQIGVLRLGSHSELFG